MATKALPGCLLAWGAVGCADLSSLQSRVLRVVVDAPYLLRHTDVFSDALAPAALGELTIL